MCNFIERTHANEAQIVAKYNLGKFKLGVCGFVLEIKLFIGIKKG